MESWHGYENINKINDKNMNIIVDDDITMNICNVMNNNSVII